MKEYNLKVRELPKYGALSSIIGEIKPGEKVLDVGCSDGYLAGFLSKNDVYGVDYNSAAIERARRVCKLAKVADLNNISSDATLLFDEKFDVIVFADVLEHLIFPETVLQYFKKMLKPNGRLIISLPNVALWRVRIQLLFGRFDYVDYGVLDNTHLHLYTFKSADKLVTSSGFKVIKIKGAANLLGPVVKFLPIFKKLLSIHIILIAHQDD
jgi:methionine biosynthesis protein MetW